MAVEEMAPLEKKALHELRLKLEESISKNQLLLPHPPFFSEQKRSSALKTRIASTAETGATNASLWGVPLLPSKSNDRLDAVLLKFLRAREFKLSETLEMIRRTLRWRKEFGVDGIHKEEIDSEEFRATAYVDGVDREGRPVCYNVYEPLRGCGRTFGSKEKQERFLRWRVQLMERGVRELAPFKLGGAPAMVQVIDLNDLQGSSVKDLRSAVERMIGIFQENYPGFIYKYIFANVSLRYYTYQALFSPLLKPRSESKFVFARSNRVTEALLKYIEPQNILVQYGGLRRANEDEFFGEDGRVSETFVRGGSIASIEIPITKPGVTIIWEIMVVGWEVTYREEFTPNDEGSYKILLKEGKKPKYTVRSSFYIYEPGKLVFTFENKTSRRKAIFYRYKAKPTFPCYKLGSNPLN